MSLLLKKVKKEPKINPMKELIKQRDIEKELESSGIRPIVPVEMNNQGTLNIDQDYLVLPKDLTEVESRELGKYLNANTQQRMYLRSLVGWQSLVVEQKKREYYNAFNAIYLNLDKKSSESSKEKYTNTHPKVQPIYYEYRDELRKLDMINLSIESISDAIFLISREISRREGDFNTEYRNENVRRK